MPGNTTPKTFRYPTLDMSPDVPRDLGYLATDIDNYLTNNPGPKGDTGNTGAQGPKGDTGNTGAQGTQGVAGPKGDPGAASTVPGPQGNPGPQGDQGVQGPKGDTGNTGAQGPKGDTGNTGAQGPKGDTGTALTVLGNYPTLSAFTSANLTGSAGDAWLILSTGTLMVWDTLTSAWFDAGDLQGPAGPVGAKGDTGEQGVPGPKGDTGEQGVQGPLGPQGVPGVQGSKGDTGLTGTQGPKGDKGDTGEQGSQATFSITSATPPLNPINGQAWFNSDNGKSYTYYDSYWVETGSSLSGPQGPKGDTGDTGATGPQGVSINLKSSALTVAALPATGNSANDARIVEADGDLYIWGGTSWTSAGQIVGPVGPEGPQGPKGDTGLTGPKGDKGDTGDTGLTGATGSQGVPGPKGDTGAQGSQGAQGTQGVAGPKGDTGADGAIGINTPITAALETMSIVAAATTGTVNINVKTSSFVYYTSNSTANFTINIRGDATPTTLNSILSVGQSITVTLLNTNGTTAYYPNAFQIDGAVVTPKWAGGTAPTAGNASSIDAYSFTIIKTAATPAYTVFAGSSKFA
jgi:collagen type VII alpha